MKVPHSVGLKLTTAFVIALLTLATALSAKTPQTLETARELANTTFKGKTYKEVDCVTFILAVVQKEIGKTLPSDVRKAILFAYGWSDSETQAIAHKGTDPRLGGVAYALATLSTLGEVVEPADAKPGDLIQYWNRKKDGTWFGHAGVISAVKNGRAQIFGAHEGIGRIAESDFMLRLTGENRRIAIVRLR